jgi:hypothetical protein
MNPFFTNGNKVLTSGGGLRKDSTDTRKVYYAQVRAFPNRTLSSVPQIAPITKESAMIFPIPAPIDIFSTRNISPIQVPIPKEVTSVQLQVPKEVTLQLQLNDDDICIGEVTNTSVSSPVLCGESMNLHFFDDKLGSVAEWVRPDINRVKLVPPEEKRNAFEILRQHITKFPFQVPEAMNSFHAVSNLEDTSNVDPITNISACDLLYILYERIVLENNEDCLDTLIIQLTDMQTGMCSQGRVTRLLQTVVMFDNFA